MCGIPLRKCRNGNSNHPFLSVEEKGLSSMMSREMPIWMEHHLFGSIFMDIDIPQSIRQFATNSPRLHIPPLLGLSHPPAIQLAKALVHLAPRGLQKVFFSDNGSTAVEIALKMAMQYWQQCPSPQPRKTQFIHLGLAYHGDTVGGMSLSGIELFQKPFSSLLFPWSASC